jgi:PiT family inorganic phosphate transporter
VDPLLLAVLLGIAFLAAFSIGGNDETLSPAVGGKVFSVRRAVIIGAITNLIGAIFMGEGVSEKVGSDLVGGRMLTLNMVFAILISMAIWLMVASATKGLPISTTQCIVGSVVGIVVFAPFLGVSGWGVEAVTWSVIIQIIVGWVLSPIIGFFISAAVFSLVRRKQRSAKGLNDRERQEQIAAYVLAGFLVITSLSRGGNDVANAVAPLVNLPEFQGTLNIGALSLQAVFIPLLIGGLGMGLGLIILGRKPLRMLATEVVTLSPSSALSASVSVTLVMFVGTFLGFPLSGTHVLVAALIAVGWIGQTPIQKKQAKNILISWLITVPISAALGIAVFALLPNLS